jgi:hypothetical protein
MRAAQEITKVAGLYRQCLSLSVQRSGDNLSPLPGAPNLTASPLYIWLSGNPGMMRALQGVGVNHHENDAVQLC